MSSPKAAGLSTGQIVAIGVSGVAAMISIIALCIAVHWYVVRRRQLHDIEEIPKREPRISPDSVVTQMERGNVNGPGLSDAATTRSSIWGDVRPLAVPAPALSGDVWDSRQWPLPPGHTERYTFFSERSSIAGDDMPDGEQWSPRGYDEKDGTGGRKPAGTGRRSETESRCESIWGISDAGIAL